VVQKANVFIWEGKYGVEQIAEGEWWSGMWRFPQAPAAAESVGEVRHVVTNHKVTLQVNLEHVAEPPAGLAWYSFEELKDLPMPAPQRRALRLCTPVESRVAVPSGGNGLAP
jgi:A/G-specific adenine glycosylase